VDAWFSVSGTNIEGECPEAVVSFHALIDGDARFITERLEPWGLGETDAQAWERSDNLGARHQVITDVVADALGPGRLWIQRISAPLANK
jgi:hypothetical protein